MSQQRANKPSSCTLLSHQGTDPLVAKRNHIKVRAIYTLGFNICTLYHYNTSDQKIITPLLCLIYLYLHTLTKNVNNILNTSSLLLITTDEGLYSPKFILLIQLLSVGVKKYTNYQILTHTHICLSPTRKT